MLKRISFFLVFILCTVSAKGQSDPLFYFKSKVPIDSVVPVAVDGVSFLKLYSKGKSCFVDKDFSGSIHARYFYDSCEVLSFKEDYLYVYRKNKKWNASFFDFTGEKPGGYVILEDVDSLIVRDKWHGLINYYKSGKMFSFCDGIVFYSSENITKIGDRFQSFDGDLLYKYRDSISKKSSGYIIQYEEVVSANQRQGYLISYGDKNGMHGIKYEMFSDIRDTVLFIYQLKNSHVDIRGAVDQLLKKGLPTVYNTDPFSEMHITIFLHDEVRDYSYSNQLLKTLAGASEQSEFYFIKDFSVWKSL